ncbi:AbrB/MazE/SpoVT family DNA-binding domain-containing protein [Leptotrichia sp. OH3620_COT-345]|nr:AbrB/MazE/SpoVT family DNA-binding domain-containing protein [Leptotrichia sp. OH3620_COT-345]
MEKRNRNISFYKAGNGVATRVNVPITWLKELGITENNKTVELVLDKENKTICIKKK